MLAVGAIRFYQWGISPLFGRNKCRFYPSCSAYAIEAFLAKGFVKGFFMAAWRILRCHPFSRGGYDPVDKEHSLLDESSQGKTDKEV
jgi:putative membrane protein insertion efficiency factor